MVLAGTHARLKRGSAPTTASAPVTLPSPIAPSGTNNDPVSQPDICLNSNKTIAANVASSIPSFFGSLDQRSRLILAQ